MTAKMKKKNSIDFSFTRPDNLLKKRRTKKKFVWFLFILLFISLGLSAYFGIQEKRLDNTSALLTIDAEASIVSGDEVVYKIFYQNIDEVDLTKMNLTLTYPRGFTFANASIDPINDGKNYWELDNLAPGFGKTIEVHGRLIGNIGDQKTIKAALAYEPANFSSTFGQEEYFSSEISNLKVDMWVDTVTEAMPAQQVQFKIHLLNKQTANWHPLILEFNNPDEFSLLASEPGGNLADDKWSIVTLEPEEETIITVMGELAPEISSDKLTFYIQLFEEIDNTNKLLDENELAIDIINPNISVSLSLVDNISVVDWGEIVNYELVVKNEGEYVPKDLNLILVFNTDFINWQDWQDATGLYREDNKIIWNKDHPKIGTKLAGLQSGEEIRLKVGAKLQSAPIDVATIKESDLIITSVAKIESSVGNEKYISSSDIVRSQIGKNFTFIAKAKYYDSDGNVVGAGPLPPQVDKTTTYDIEWNLVAGLENLTDIVLKTTLPPYIQWLNEQTGYAARFNSSKKELIIDSSALNAGEELSGTFQISIKPNNTQIGQVLVLLNPMSLTAVNKQSGEKINKQIDLVDTNLIYDTLAKDKSRVIE